MCIELNPKIAEFDGKHVEPLRYFSDQFQPDSSSINRIISCIENEDENAQIEPLWNLLKCNVCVMIKLISSIRNVC